MNAIESDQLTGPVAGIVIPWTRLHERPSAERIEETRGLVDALGGEACFLNVEQVRKPTPSHLLSGGLLERLKSHVDNAECDLVVIDSSLSPMQQRNLERDLGVKVIDRTGLILEIFGLRARTKEGRLQVELARLVYERSRLVRTWTHLERQRGGGAFTGGPGETQLEADKRMLDRAVLRLRRELEDVRRTRDVQRAARIRSETPIVALIGYTNSGKSTLFNRLSESDVLARDMPFATLDPTIRKLVLPNLGEVALVDTVGFITDLPTTLIDAFRATLEETLEADLLVHVRDRSSEADEVQKDDVLTVLNQLSATTEQEIPPILEAWNKIDLLTVQQRRDLGQMASVADDPQPVLISALTGDGVNQLITAIETFLSADQRRYKVELDPSAGAERAWLHAHGTIESETASEDGQLAISVRLSKRDAGRLRSQFPDILLERRPDPSSA